MKEVYESNPSQDQEVILMRTQQLEAKVSNLFSDIGSRLSPLVKSMTLMTDDNFVHRRDRTSNDIHLFLELKNGKVLHLRAYVRHMLETEIQDNGIFLTAYLKDQIEQTGGAHSLRQGSYNWSAEEIVEEIKKQNPDLF